MKFVLVDRSDSIVDKIELASNVGLSGARTVFIGRKQIEKKEFDNLWKVMTESEYNRKMKIYTRKPSHEYEESGDWIDIEKS